MFLRFSMTPDSRNAPWTQHPTWAFRESGGLGMTPVSGQDSSQKIVIESKAAKLN